MKRDLSRWLPAGYVVCMVVVMLGYVRFDPYQIDGDAVSYMDVADLISHGKWHRIVNGLWNPGYPALLALGKLLTHADRMRELQMFYRVNFCIFLFSVACTWFFVRSILFVRTAGASTRSEGWVFSGPLLYCMSYATVFLSWQSEFSPGKIRVDGLFASLLLLAFAFLLRSVYTPRWYFDLAFGFSLGVAYLVKSPGFVLTIVVFVLLIAYCAIVKPVTYRYSKLLPALAMFIAIAGPYIAALSIHKGRFDVGDSGKLNYAWYVGGTEPQHLLNTQRGRFGNSIVHLKHSEVELLSDPVVVYFPQFPNATYGPWFDPSYFNDGVRPRVSLGRQFWLTLQQSKYLVRFVVSHSLPIVLLLFCFAAGVAIVRSSDLRRMLILLYVFLIFSFAMYLCVHFLNRYVAGQFWIVWIATAALLAASGSRRDDFMRGAGAFLTIAILLVGLQSVMQQHRRLAMAGLHSGWQNPAEFDTARALRAHGILPGDTVACFRACNHGPYWARLAGLHVESEIFDPAYMPDDATGTAAWRKLPNKQRALQALASTGAKALVGYFETTPDDENWRPLAGGYYWIPLRQSGGEPAQSPDSYRDRDNGGDSHSIPARLTMSP